jgi:hypothetical protein
VFQTEKETVMASVKNETEKTPAQKQLDFAVGDARVSLGGLSDSEFISLLGGALGSVNLRELRGFKPLKDLLTMRPGSITYGRQKTHGSDLETISVSKEASLEFNGSSLPSAIDWQTHVLSICRGWTERSFIFRRLETEDETNDYLVASSWGASGYLFAGEGEILAIRRPRNHARGEECLFTIRFKFEKISLRHEHVISAVSVRKITLHTFRDYFEDRSSRIATELIWELSAACSRTVDALKTQIKVMQDKSIQLNRLGEAISYSS